MVAGLVAWLAEMRVFAAFFDDTGFGASWAEGEGIGSEGGEQLAPESGALPRAATLGEGVAPLAEAVESAFEADRVQGHGLVGGGRGHEPANEIMSGQKDQ